MKEKISFLADLVLVTGGACLLVYVFFFHLFGLLAPFLVGWAIALVVKRPAAGMHRLFPLLSRGGCRLILAAFAAFFVGGGLVWCINGLVRELSLLLSRMQTGDALAGAVASLAHSVPFLGEWAEQLFDLLRQEVLRILPGFLASAAGILPRILLCFFVSLASAVYFCLDLERVHAAVFRLLPKGVQHWKGRVQKSAFSAAACILRADLLLMLITFVIMLPGFFLLRLQYPLALALVISFFDLLPAIGAGFFLLPMGCILLVSGRLTQGVGVLFIFLLVVLIRQLAEPHLLGAQLGLHPLLALFSLYVGERLFGWRGLFLFPLLTLFVSALLHEKNKKAPQRGAEKTEKA